jgi:hypothetical protein
MNEHPQMGATDAAELFLSRAYQRILRITLWLSLAGTVAVTLFLGWRNGIGFLIGAPVAYMNLVWLHHGATMMVDRMMGSSVQPRSKARLALAFAGRYALLFILAYVILKSFPGIWIGFMVALFAPIVAAMSEGIYEAIVNGKTRFTAAPPTDPD